MTSPAHLARRGLWAGTVALLAPWAGAADHLGRLHTPHDNAHDVASGPLAGGGVEILVAGSDVNKLMRSIDRGLSWSALSGDGLELEQIHRLEYWHHPGQRRYFIGTEHGVWSYYPDTGLVQKTSAGLALIGSNGFIASLAASRNGSGPVLLATRAGVIYGWDEGTGQWQAQFQGSGKDQHAQVAIAPYYDPLQPPGPQRLVLAGVAGVLHVSSDGGATWTVHSQFATPAQSSADWSITALAFAEDYHQSGVVLLGRGRANAANPSGNEGEVWRSADSGATWSLVHGLGSTVRAIEASGPDPAGNRHLYLAVEYFPDARNVAAAVGVPRSDDGGLTWQDFGNYQDFLLEESAADVIVPDRYGIVGICPSWDFASDATVFYGRAESLYRSSDAGYTWLQLRSRQERQFRGLDVTTGASGELLAFGATYGAGTLKIDLSSGQTEILDYGKSSYQQPVQLSPNYAGDGVAVVGGSFGLDVWADSTKPITPLYGKSGWVLTAGNPLGNVRTVALSPHFDASNTLPDADQTLYFSTIGEKGSTVYRSEDGGLSFVKVDGMSFGASKTAHLPVMVVAPTYDAHQPNGAGRVDVFGVAYSRVLVALDNTIWNPLYQAPVEIRALALHPDWSRPANPRLYLGLASAPYLVEALVDPAGLIAVERPAPGLDGLLESIALAPDFATNPVIYAATWGTGVKKLDLAAATPQWTGVGDGLPPVYARPLRLSPDFLNDRRLLLGGSEGLLHCQDLPGSVWQQLDSPYTVDNLAGGVTYYAPNDPANPQPQRPWGWSAVGRVYAESRFPGLLMVSRDTAATDFNGSHLTFEVYAGAVELRTHRGPLMGEALLSVSDPDSGALLASSVTDLYHPVFESHRIRLAVPGSPQPVVARVEALLAPGELLSFDGLTIEPY